METRISEMRKNMKDKLVWLWTHCRVLGMTELSNAIPEDQRKNSNGMELDIALNIHIQ